MAAVGLATLTPSGADTKPSPLKPTIKVMTKILLNSNSDKIELNTTERKPDTLVKVNDKEGLFSDLTTQQNETLAPLNGGYLLLKEKHMKLRPLFFALPALLTLISAPRTHAQVVVMSGVTGGSAGQMFKGGKETQNPDISAVNILLNRDDVKTEIAMSQRQSEQMTAEQDRAAQQVTDNLKEQLSDPITLTGDSADEQSAKLKEIVTKIQDLAQTQTNLAFEANEKKAKEILRSTQWERLQQLDLQWRGALALANPKLAERFQLTTDQKSKILELNNDYWKQSQQNIFSGFSFSPQDTEAIKAKFAKRKKECEQLHKTQNEKALAILTDAQKAAWTAAQGNPFKFRAED